MYRIKVQLFRKQKHITQEELAFRINKSKDTVSNIERGLAFARIETLIDICNELAVELRDLFDCIADCKLHQIILGCIVILSLLS